MKCRVVSRLAMLLAASATSCAFADSFYWIGSVSTQWTVPGNWINQTQGGIPGVPGPGDSVNLAYASVQLNGDAVVDTVFGYGTVSVNGSLVSGSASNCSIVLNAGLLDIPVLNTATLVLNGGDLAGQPALNSCSLWMYSPGHLDAILTGSNTLYGSVQLGQHLTARASGSSSVLLYFPSPLTSSGVISLEDDGAGESRLRCDYTIINNGTIEMHAQSSVLQAALENYGNVNISGGATFAAYGATYRNLGGFAIAPSGSLQVNGIAQTFVQADGTFAGAERSTFYNMGFRNYGGEFVPEAGHATGPTLYNCTLENYASGAVNFSAYGGTTMYGHVYAGQSVFSRNWNGEGSSLLYFPGPVTNAGLIVVDSQFQSTSGTLRTDYTMTNTGIVELAGQGSRLFLGSLSNSGIFTINAPTSFGSYGALFANEGQLVLNAPLSAGPLAQTFRQISGTVAHAERLTMNSMYLRFEGGAFEPSAGHSLAPLLYDCVYSNETAAPIALDARGTTTFYGNIASGQIVRCSEIPSGSNPYLYFPGPISNAGEIIVTSDSNRSATLRTDYTLTNTGTVRIQSGGGGSRVCLGSLVNQGAYLIDAPTTFASYGATYTNRGQMTISPAHSLSISELAQTFVQENGTLNNASRILMNSISFAYTGGDVSPEGGMPSGPKLTNCVLSISGTGPLDLDCTRTTTIYGQVSSGQTLRFLNSDTNDAAYAYFPNPITNSGHLIVTSRNGAAPATLRTDYTLTNAAGGIVEFLAGTGGNRVFVGSLVNHGLWSVQADTSAVSYGAQFTNDGLFSVADGTNFQFGGLPQTFNQAAPGSISGGRNIKGRSGGSFQYLGGQFAGDGPELTDCVVAFSADAINPIDLLLHGTTTFYGNILPEHKIASIATPGADAFLYFPNPITNQGQITLSTLDPDRSSRSRSDYTFINDGRLHLDPGGRVEGSTFVQHASGTTHFVLKGIEPAEFGRLAIAGVVSIDGTVTNQTVPGYTAYDQDHWDVISAAGGLIGTYATEALDPGFSFRYEGQRGRLVFLRCAADYNLDGGVDGSDVDAFFFDWERGLLSSDVNADGGVDGSDVSFFFDAWESGGCP